MLSYLVCGPDAAATDRVLGELADGVAALLGGDGDLDTVLQGMPGRGEEGARCPLPLSVKLEAR